MERDKTVRLVLALVACLLVSVFTSIMAGIVVLFAPGMVGAVGESLPARLLIGPVATSAGVGAMVGIVAVNRRLDN